MATMLQKWVNGNRLYTANFCKKKKFFFLEKKLHNSEIPNSAFFYGFSKVNQSSKYPPHVFVCFLSFFFFKLKKNNWLDGLETKVAKDKGKTHKITFLSLDVLKTLF